MQALYIIDKKIYRHHNPKLNNTIEHPQLTQFLQKLNSKQKHITYSHPTNPTKHPIQKQTP